MGTESKENVQDTEAQVCQVLLILIPTSLWKKFIPLIWI